MDNRVSLFVERLKSSALARGFLQTFIGSGAAKVILILSTFVFSNMMTKDGFGTFSFMRNTMNIMLGICAINYSGLVTKFTTEVLYKKESLYRLAILFFFTLFSCVFLAIIILSVPDRLLSSLNSGAYFSHFFRIAGLLLPLFILQPLIEGILRGIKRFKLIGILQTLLAICFVVFIVFGYSIWGVKGAIIGLLFYYSLFSIVSVVVLITKTDFLYYLHDFEFRSIHAQIGTLWRMILPVFILSFIEAPINWWGQALISKHDSIGSVGSLSAILQIRNLLIIVPDYFFSTFMTFQSVHNAQNDQGQYYKNQRLTFLILLPLSILASLVLIRLGGPILGLYGSEYKNDIVPFYIAMASFPMLISLSLFRCHLLIKEHQILMLVTSILSSFLFIGTMYLKINRGTDPLQSFFWGQIAYYLVSFGIFGLCCLVDRRRDLSHSPA